MDESVQWMTLQELRDELDRTRPAWEELADLMTCSRTANSRHWARTRAFTSWYWTSCCGDRMTA